MFRVLCAFDLKNKQIGFLGWILNLCVEKVRLGWHDAGTYDKNVEEWPKRGGANGSLRFEIELKHAANAGACISYFSYFETFFW